MHASGRVLQEDRTAYIRFIAKDIDLMSASVKMNDFEPHMCIFWDEMR